MTGTAKVAALSADGKIAEVEAERKSACEGCHKGADGCAACSLLGPNKKITCKALNKAGAAIGDTVEIESDSRRMLIYAAVIFILPVVAGIAGYLLASLLSDSELVRAAAAAAGFAVSIGGAVLWSSIRSRKSTDVVIVRIVGEDDQNGRE